MFLGNKRPLCITFYRRHTEGMLFLQDGDGISSNRVQIIQIIIKSKTYHCVNHRADFISADFFHDCFFNELVLAVTKFVDIFLKYCHCFRVKGNRQFFGSCAGFFCGRLGGSFFSGFCCGFLLLPWFGSFLKRRGEFYPPPRNILLNRFFRQISSLPACGPEAYPNPSRAVPHRT